MLVELTRQPARHWRALADDFTDAKDGLQPAMIDPSHGTLLIQAGLRPNLRERVAPGGVIAYVIIFIGLIGAVLAAYPLLFLFLFGRAVRAHLGNSRPPLPAHPLSF